MIQPKTIRIDGVNLFYATNQEVKTPPAPVIFFFHGNSSSHATWQCFLESAALAPYTCFAFDLPAHGRSDAAADATDDYSLPGMARLFAKAVTQLSGGQPFILVGVSLGANIIAEMLPFHVQPAGIFLLGPTIVGGSFTVEKALKLDSCVGLSFVDEITDDQLESLKDLCAVTKDQAIRRQLDHDIRAVKDNFRSRFGATVAAGNYNDQVALIREAFVPMSVVFGGAEGAVHPDYLDEAGFNLLQKEVVKLPGAGHFVHLDAPAAVTALLAELATAVFKQVGS